MDPKAWPTSGQNVCRCCLAEGCYKDISTEYFWMGKREVYSDMLNETFDVNISFSKSGSTNSRLICEPCISRLRDASEFKKQVVDCERMFMNHLSEPGSSTMAEPLSTLTPDDVKVIKVEAVKQEKDSDGDEDFADTTDFLDDDDDDEDDLDNQPLTKFATKVPKKEAVDIMDLLDNTELTIKRKAPTKTKAVPAKKAKTTTKVTAKATVSKAKTAQRPKTAAATKAVVEKKKKEKPPIPMPRQNAELIVKHTTAYPFRLPDSSMLCVYCYKSIDDPKIYREHMEEEHKDYYSQSAFGHLKTPGSHFKVDCTDFKCRICKEPLTDLKDACAHLQKHGIGTDPNADVNLQVFNFGGEKWVCCFGNCREKFPCLRQLSRHIATHYHKHICESCGKSYTDESALKKHVRYVHDNCIYCKKCLQKFPTAAARREHVLASKKCWTYTCPHCPNRFLNETTKREHLVKEHGKERKTYNCSECAEVYATREAYRNHFHKFHTDKYPCNVCGEKFETSLSLVEHVVKHTGEKLHKCPHCPKTFATKGNLYQHSWVHSEVKRYECTICVKKFNQRVSWKHHMRARHPELVDFD